MLGFGKLARAAFGSSNDRKIKSIQPIVDKINSLEANFEEFADEALIKKTDELKERYKNGETLDSLLPEALRTVGKRRSVHLDYGHLIPN